MQHLVLLHGATGSEKQLVALSELSGGTYHVHTLNFEGHGGRPGPDAFSFESFAENILEYLDANGIAECVLFGYSMGGYAALKFAALYPGKATAIVTLATKFEWSPAIAAKETALLDPEAIAEKVPKFAAMLEALHAPLDWKTVVRNTASLLTDLGNGKGLSEEELKKIGVPVLLCLGSEDKMVSQAETDAVAQILPRAETIVIAGAQHQLERTDPELIVEQIRKFAG